MGRVLRVGGHYGSVLVRGEVQVHREEHHARARVRAEPDGRDERERLAQTRHGFERDGARRADLADEDGTCRLRRGAQRRGGQKRGADEKGCREQERAFRV